MRLPRARLAQNEDALRVRLDLLDRRAIVRGLGRGQSSQSSDDPLVSVLVVLDQVRYMVPRGVDPIEEGWRVVFEDRSVYFSLGGMHLSITCYNPYDRILKSSSPILGKSCALRPEHLSGGIWIARND